MNNSNTIIHTIRPGDTLYSIATMYGITVQEIMNANMGLNPYNLQIGSQLFIYPNHNNMMMSINEVNLLNKMNLMWIEHVLWTRLLLISIAGDLKDLEATKARLLENPRDIANIFRIYYGNSVANTIQTLLTEHLAIGYDLIVALKEGNETAAQELNTAWYKNADQMADAFSSINPFYTKEEVRRMLYEHLRLTTEEVSLRLQNKFAEDIKAYDMVQREALQMSRFFVNGIVKQFPSLF